MRVLDIISLNPILLEFAIPNQGVHLVARLDSILKSTDPSSDEYLEAVKLLQQIIVAGADDAVPQPVQEPATAPVPQEPIQQQPQEVPVEQDVEPEEPQLAEATASASSLVSKAKKSEKALTSKERQAFLAKILELEERLARAEDEKIKHGKQQFKQGQKKEFETNKAAFNKVSELAIQLAHKVGGTLNAMKAAYDEQIARGDYEGDTAPSRTAVKAPTPVAKKELINLITDMFSRPLGSSETIAERNSRLRILSGFMTQCIEGIVDFEDLLDERRGNVLVNLDEEAQQVMEMIGNLLLIKPSATAGNWGPGELGLAILGTPVQKGKKGDLLVNGRDIELKASQNPEKGGRLGTIALNKGDAGYSTYEKALKTLFASAGYKKGDLDFTLKKKEEVAEARAKKVKELKKSVLPSNNVGVYLDDKGNEKDIKWTSFGRTFVENALNPKIKNRVGVEITKNFLRVVATSCLIDRYKTKAGGEWDTSFVDGCVNTDGTIDYDSFSQGYAKMLYDIYQVIDKKGEIMVLNPLTGSYYVLLSSDDFDEATTPGQGYQHVRVGSVAIDFTDSQGKASPQIGIA